MSNLAKFLDSRIIASHKKAKEIAGEMGLSHPNFLSMIRKGQSRLPWKRIIPLADSLGVSRAGLLHLAMREYQPDVYVSCSDFIAQDDNEVALLQAYRRKRHSRTGGGLHR